MVVIFPQYYGDTYIYLIHVKVPHSYIVESTFNDIVNDIHTLL